MTKRKKGSSKGWLKEHFDDVWVKRAFEQGYRSRSAFKLLELQQKDKLLKPGMRVVDLGAAPGGWLQVASKVLATKGQLIGLDLLQIDTLAGVHFIRGDFREASALAELERAIDGQKLDVVLSDMAPNISGVDAVDMPRAMYLGELAHEFAVQQLRPGGTLLVKLFQGEGFEQITRELRQNFTSLALRKPAASRSRSREVYALAKGLK